MRKTEEQSATEKRPPGQVSGAGLETSLLSLTGGMFAALMWSSTLSVSKEHRQ